MSETRNNSEVFNLAKPHNFSGDRRFCRGCGLRQAVARGECVANGNRPAAQPEPDASPTPPRRPARLAAATFVVGERRGRQ